MNIYVGNLSFKAGEEELRQAFSAYGTVTSVAIIKDKITGDSRGFGFVEMASASESSGCDRSPEYAGTDGPHPDR